MNCSHTSIRLVAAVCFSAASLAAQSVDDTVLKQVIVFSRHGARSPAAGNSILDTFSVRAFPSFGIAPDLVTSNGAADETLMGGYYRLWLTKEKLLTGNDTADAAFVYFRPNVAESTTKITAQALAAGMLPGATVNLNFYPQPSDPLFDPVGAGVALLDGHMALAAVNGRLGGNPQSLASAYAPEMALTRSLLLNYPISETPPPAAPKGTIDVTALPITVTAGKTVQIGGLEVVGAAVDPFLMEYADGMMAADVGWGQLTPSGISQILRFHTLLLDLEFRTPYLAGVQSSNVASHIVRSLVQAATGNALTGSLANPATKVIVLLASDTNVAGLAGLLHLDWVLPGYQPDFCVPGGAVVFELRQSQTTGEYIVRASYIAQTMDQLHNRTTLTLDAPPAIAPLFITGCSVRNATFDCPIASFVKMAKHAIDAQSVDLINEPGGPRAP